MRSHIKRYSYFIVVLTNRGELVEDYVTGTNFSEAYETFLDEKDLAGQIKDYKFCLHKGIK